METGEKMEPEFWADEPLETFEPDLARGAALLRERRKRSRVTSRVAGLAAVAALVSVCALAFPASRVFAGRCVNACVAAFSLSAQPAAPLVLSEYAGKVVVLNFWATWCAPCQKETPLLVELQKKYGDAGLVVVGASLDEDGWTSVRPFMRSMGVNYRMVLADAAMERTFGEVEVLPATMVIDRAGRLVKRYDGLITRGDFEGEVRATVLGPGD